MFQCMYKCADTGVVSGSPADIDPAAAPAGTSATPSPGLMVLGADANWNNGHTVISSKRLGQDNHSLSRLTIPSEDSVNNNNNSNNNNNNNNSAQPLRGMGSHRSTTAFGGYDNYVLVGGEGCGLYVCVWRDRYV